MPQSTTVRERLAALDEVGALYRYCLHRHGLFNHGLCSYGLHRFVLRTHGLQSDGLHNHSRYNYGLNIHGPYIHGLYSHGLCLYRIYGHGLYSHGLRSQGLYRHALHGHGSNNELCTYDLDSHVDYWVRRHACVRGGWAREHCSTHASHIQKRNRGSRFRRRARKTQESTSP